MPTDPSPAPQALAGAADRPPLEFRAGVQAAYPDLYTPEALAALDALAGFDDDRRALMAARIQRRADRTRAGQRIAFLDPDATIGRTGLTVRQARAGEFSGADIPAALRRQWIQGTGPGARPRAALATSLRNVAYALLSGADGWMFDGEDALGQVDTMALDNQRNLKLALARDPQFLAVAEGVATEMNAWAQGFFGQPIIEDWRQQLDFTTVIFRARGLHLDDRHVRWSDGRGFSASIVDAALYVVHNHRALRDRGAPVVLYLPKIQTADEAALWNDILSALETAPGPARGHDPGLRAGGAAGGQLPAHGDPRRPGPALRGLQHRPLGLHQQRGRRHGLGPGLSPPQHRRRHHDLRLHAQLRGPRPARRQHAGPRRPPRPVAGRHGAQHPRGLGSRRDGRHGQGRGRRRAGAAGRGQRQVGGALEDGAHHAPGVGAGRARTTSSAAPSRPSPTPTRTRPASPCWSRPRAPSAAPAIS